MPKRLHNWPTLLDAYIHSHRSTPFEWGVHDCCLFAAGAAETILGKDLGIKYRKAYTTADSALHLIHVTVGVGLRDLLKQMASNYGFVVINPKTAQRGDIVMFESNNGVGITLGVVMGTKLVVPGLRGLEFIDIDTVWNLPTTKAWKIG